MLSWTLGAGRIALALLASIAVVPARAESPEETFLRGYRAYDQGHFDEAAAAYSELIRQGIEDPRVEYNLGNAEFRRGRLGPAILHFERALRLDPADAEIRGNLEYARSMRVDQVPPRELPAWVSAARHLLDRLGPDRLAWGALALVWIVCAFLTWAYAAPGRWRAAHGWALAGLGVALAVVASGWYAARAGVDGQPVAVVLAERTAVLAGPGGNNAQLATVHEGLDVEVWSERAGWVQVRLPNGLSGWIEREALERVR